MIAAFPSAMPVQGLLGGMLIGVAAAIMLLGVGRIAGVSGLFARATGTARTGAPRSLAMAFTIGLPVGAAVTVSLIAVPAHFPASLPLIAVAGLLVGFGTRLGGGCTSGHGVCGLSRLSPRSIAATVVFISMGILTVTIMRLAGFGV